MLNVPASVAIYVYTAPADLRKGFDGLSGIVRDKFQADPLDGSLFLFVWFRQACATQDFFCAQGRAAPGRVTEWEATARRFSLAGRAESAPPMSEGRRARGC
jgi:hypothetical protein